MSWTTSAVVVAFHERLVRRAYARSLAAYLMVSTPNAEP